MGRRAVVINVFLLIYGICAGRIWADESCWTSVNTCTVKAELFVSLEYTNGVAMQIDCLASGEGAAGSPLSLITAEKQESDSGNGAGHDHQPATSTSASFAYSFVRRFMGMEAVMLDGCQTPLNAHTYGLEFLAICSNVTKVSLRHFHMDSLLPLQCGPAGSEEQLELQYLHLKDNEIASIDTNSFQGRYPHLRDVEFDGNSLKIIQGSALRSLKSLEHLRIVNEPVLMLKSADLFEYTAAISIHLEALKQVTSDVFHHLPETLQSLYVAYTQLDRVDIELINARALTNLTVAFCAVEAFTLRDSHSTVKSISLTGNTLKSFAAFENRLIELDLSSNQLQHFEYDWLKNLSALQMLNLRDNQLKMVSLHHFHLVMPQGRNIDMRGNRLQALHDAYSDLNQWIASQMRIRCDHNPWDCLWLHDFAHSHPEKFRILQYDKFISKINVNGLECVPAEKGLEPQQEPTAAEGSETDNFMPLDKAANVSTFHLVYGDPMDFKRNQRAEALIIVFMLPVGIAFLFLLLYMWIYCQKMFHLSYYKNFSCMRKQAPMPPPSQRFDVVREIPPHLQTIGGTRPHPTRDQMDVGYEVPLNGLYSECNCRSLSNAVDRCNKTVHITYEEPPADIPHQIYEEIISVEEGTEGGDFDHEKLAPLHYDHLRHE